MSKKSKFREYKAKAQVKLSMPLILKMAREMDKSEFLSELKSQWQPFVTRHSTLDEEMTKVNQRIKQSGLKKAFEIVGVTDADIREVLREIRKEKFSGEKER